MLFRSERFVTPTDPNARAVPGLRRAFDPSAVPDLTPSTRPDVKPPETVRTPGSLTPRNLPGRTRVIRGSWTAQIAGGEKPAATTSASSGPQSLRQAPAPSRTWVPQVRLTPAAPAARPSGFGTTALPQPRGGAAPAGGWRAAVGSGAVSGVAAEIGRAHV